MEKKQLISDDVLLLLSCAPRPKNLQEKIFMATKPQSSSRTSIDVYVPKTLYVVSLAMVFIMALGVSEFVKTRLDDYHDLRIINYLYSAQGGYDGLH
ncbi:MAG: hypothetical protein EBZ69_08300 [Alphaproteobacteria bacterium]|nr:hypothetical protein [Alphaproteobacteria bacterium]NDG05099.1 hypothetical protein [Alphaproteobacteria bacterium]